MSEAEAEFISVKEVARILSVTQRTVYRWIRDGKLRAVRIGGTVRVPRVNLLDLPVTYESRER